MSKITPKQRKDIECVKYFIPPGMKDIPITEKDEIMFLENSERGLHKELISAYFFKTEHKNGFNALVQGKVWRGRHMEMYEGGVLEGTMPYFTLLGGDEKATPRAVVDFMKKTMFKGDDARIIEKTYKQILKETPLLAVDKSA